jgi:signal transduction histidine kinase
MISRPETGATLGWMRVRRDVAIDVALALAAFGATLALLFAHSSGREIDALGVVLAVFSTLPLLARRRSPLAVLTVTTAASAALYGLDYVIGPPFGPTLALFFVASHEQTRARIRSTSAVVIALLALHLGAAGLGLGEFPLAPILFAILVWGTAWVVGDQVRQRRQRLQQLEERALRAERESERERRLAVAEERMRIARDLHDSAGHAINVILVQAGAARLLGEKDPEQAEVAVATIEQVARETLGEIDKLVGALRENGVGGDVEPPLGLAALESLAARHRAAGLAVSVRTRGPAQPLPPRLDLAAYRILQEALTNAARHGNGSAEVAIAFGPSALELTVTNPVGPATPPAGGGHGLVGMRERAALLGGALEASPSDGLFRVHARLPYDGERT